MIAFPSVKSNLALSLVARCTGGVGLILDFDLARSLRLNLYNVYL